MRKNFITKEYSIEPIAGTYNMAEQKSFFSSKILEIEDILYVDNNNINWTESVDESQGIILEDLNKSFNSSLVKNENHSLRIFPNQTEQQRKEFTRWKMSINIRNIITEYIFSKLKSNRTFENISNSNTYNNSINNAIYDYIKYNVYPRIKFSNIVLYIKYYKIGELQDSINEGSNIALQYENNFSEDLITPQPKSGESTINYSNRIIDYRESIKVKNFQLSTDPQQNVATVIYKQIKSSLDYKFDYYYDIIWEKE